jgi:hypothetical protein
MKTRLHRHLLKPVIKYTNDTWTSTDSDEVRRCKLERETLRKIYGPMQETGEGTVRYSQELCQLYRLLDIIRTVRVGAAMGRPCTKTE